MLPFYLCRKLKAIRTNRLPATTSPSLLFKPTAIINFSLEASTESSPQWEKKKKGKIPNGARLEIAGEGKFKAHFPTFLYIYNDLSICFHQCHFWALRQKLFRLVKTELRTADAVLAFTLNECVCVPPPFYLCLIQPRISIPRRSKP